MSRFGIGELILILLIVLVLFGASRVPKLSKALGESIREFKKGRSQDKEKESKDKSGASSD